MNKSENTTPETTELEIQSVPGGRSFSANNGMVIVCAIVSIVTCCFSLNLATTQYKKSADNLKKFHQLLLKETAQLRAASSEPVSTGQIVSHEEDL